MLTNTKPRVLILENDPEVIEILRYGFISCGFEVGSTQHPTEAIELMATKRVDVFIFDTFLEYLKDNLIRAVNTLGSMRPSVICVRGLWNSVFTHENIIEKIKSFLHQKEKLSEILADFVGGLQKHPAKQRLKAGILDKTFNLGLSLDGNSKMHHASVSDLSEGGMFVKLPKSLDFAIHPADEVDFVIDPGDDEWNPIMGKAKIKWAKYSEQTHLLEGFGAEFISIGPREAKID